MSFTETETIIASDVGWIQGEDSTVSEVLRFKELWDVQKTVGGVLVENRVRPLWVHLDSTATWVLIHNEAG
jgi:hypothetical protein